MYHRVPYRHLECSLRIFQLQPSWDSFDRVYWNCSTSMWPDPQPAKLDRTPGLRTLHRNEAHGFVSLSNRVAWLSHFDDHTTVDHIQHPAWNKRWKFGSEFSFVYSEQKKKKQQMSEHLYKQISVIFTWCLPSLAFSFGVAKNEIVLPVQCTHYIGWSKFTRNWLVNQ